MLRLLDIRDYIASLGLTSDTQVYIGKLDNKKQKSIGIYNRKKEEALRIPLGGLTNATYDIKPISILIHWSKSYTESEKKAYEVWECLVRDEPFSIGEHIVYFTDIQTAHPIDVGTDDNGVYEFVIFVDFIYERKRG